MLPERLWHSYRERLPAQSFFRVGLSNHLRLPLVDRLSRGTRDVSGVFGVYNGVCRLSSRRCFALLVAGVKHVPRARISPLKRGKCQSADACAAGLHISGTTSANRGYVLFGV